MRYSDLFWKDVSIDEFYCSIEDAIMTCCHICGERLEWDIKIIYSSYLDAPVFTGTSFSCGIQYSISYDKDFDVYRITLDV